MRIFFSEGEETATAKQQVQRELKASVQQPGMHLFPVHCPELAEHPGGHWAPHEGIQVIVRAF